MKKIFVIFLFFVAFNCTLLGQTTPCNDPLEPNNTAATATAIVGLPYTSPPACLLANANDEDWFSFSAMGRSFRIKARLFA